MDIATIEKELKTGQVAPQRLAEMSDYLAGTSSSLMDRQLALQIGFTAWHRGNRDEYKSDKSAQIAWNSCKYGREELELETTQKKIKILLQTIGRSLRVAENQARNLY